MSDKKSAPNSETIKNYSLASAILGGVSIPMTFCGGLCCVPFPLIGLGLGIYSYNLAKKENLSTNTAMIGIALSALALLMIVGFTVLGVAVSLSNPSSYRYY